jgi:hypothetical protein
MTIWKVFSVQIMHLQDVGKEHFCMIMSRPLIRN